MAGNQGLLEEIFEAPRLSDQAFRKALDVEFAEILVDSKRLTDGLPVKTELFQIASRIYCEIVSAHPGVAGHERAILFACRRAKIEIEARQRENVSNGR